MACNAENADDAVYCRQCGFTLRWQEEESPTPLPDTAVIAREVALNPPSLQVVAGSDAEARVSYSGPPLRWSVIGEAASFVAVSASAGGATVSVRPGAGELPRSLPIEVQGLSGADTAVVARGGVEILAAPPPPSPPRPRPPRSYAKLLAATAVAAALVVVLLVVLSSRGGIHGVITATPRAAVVRKEPRIRPDNDVDRLTYHRKVVIKCFEPEQDGHRWFRLVRPDSGNYVAGDLVSNDSLHPPPC